MQRSIQKINIVYATQTGISYDLSKQFLLSECNKFHFNKLYDIAQLQNFSQKESNCLWIFFISTTGQGDFPYSMRNIWKKMMLKTFPLLNWMKFSIYSLGDRSYGDNFCLAARKFRQRLLSLKAQQVVQIGLGDQQQSNGYLQQYRDKWMPNLMQYLTKTQTQISKQNGIKQQSIKLNNLSEIKSYSNCSDIKILNKEQICDNKGRRTFTIDLEIIGYHKQIQTGDILSIYPHNNPQHVQWLLNYFKLKKEDAYKPQGNQEGKKQLTYQQLFSQYLNISSTLNHSFFIPRPDIQNLSAYCDNQLFRQKLIQLQKDYDQYHNYIKKYKRNIIEVLTDFQIKLPVHQFIKRCGQIITRKYSICQIIHNTNDKKIIRILYRLVQSKINQNRLHKGLCSHDLTFWAKQNDLRKGMILKGQFGYQEKTKNNLIFISLGTGIAPFCQFLDLAKKSTNQWNIKIFYTNRFKNQVYFQNILKYIPENKKQLFLSITGQGGKRITRLVENNIEAIQGTINQHKHNYQIMICGPKQVCQGLENILSRQLNVDTKLLRKKKILLYQNW